MDIKVRCLNHQCGRASRFGYDVLGRSFRCSKCGGKLSSASEASYVSSTDGLGSSRERLKSSWLDQDSTGTRRQLGVATPTHLGRYQIRGLLGSGSCATVYRAFDPELEREVALKVPHPGSLSSLKARARFVGEAKALARLRHPGIISLYEAGQHGGVPYIATAFIAGKTLDDLIAEGPIPFARAIEVGIRLAEALDYAHGQGVVHRDVKPANVLIETSGAVHLTDFGLSHRDDAASLTRAGALIGTPAYLAPEQTAIDGASALPLADQYSLGVVLYEMLCGRRPFVGPPALVIHSARHESPLPPRILRPETPRAIETICLKAMARWPAERYPSCLALAADLRGIQEGKPPEADFADQVTSRAEYWFRRRLPVAAVNSFGLTASAILATALFSPPATSEQRMLASIGREAAVHVLNAQSYGVPREKLSLLDDDDPVIV